MNRERQGFGGQGDSGARPPAPNGTAGSAEERALKAMPILVVDDERDDALLLERMLEREGFGQVTATGDPERVPALCAELRPQLILLDLHMPGLDGFEVMRRLASRGPSEAGIPVVVLTADARVEPRRKALAMGARDFLTKPFDLQEVVLRVRNILEVRRLQLDLEDRVRERTLDLEGAQLEILDRLALAAEYRDDETQEHAYRIGRASSELARGLALSEQTQALLARAAPLHDIGKIGVPDAILLKPGRLAQEEFEVVKGHAETGAGMLSESEVPIIRLAERIALTHHERWDGSGYPRGLAGEEIPLAGRIVGLADGFDALANTRPYKDAWPLGRAVAEVRDQAGRQFDPDVVEAFVVLDHERLLSSIGREQLPRGPLPAEGAEAEILD